MKKFKVGDTAYHPRSFTKYKILGYWGEYYVVKSDKYPPTLRLEEDLVGSVPFCAQLKHSYSGHRYAYLFDDPVFVGEILVSKKTGQSFKVASVMAQPNSTTPKFEGYRLGDKV